jgi:hypothetical protein
MQIDQMKLIRQVLFVLATCLVAFSCKKAPTYPSSPQIGFVSVNKLTVITPPQAGMTEPTRKDSVSISISFKDGDGDLGTDNAEVNYFCRVRVKVGNEFKDIIDTLSDETKLNPIIIDKNGSIPPLNPDGKKRALDGIINYGVDLAFFAYLQEAKVYVFKFVIYVKDNAGNMSNVIETSEVEANIYPEVI